MKLPSPILALLAAAAFIGSASAVAAQPAFKADPAKGQTVATPCLACHSADGSRGVPANPIIQGQHPEYIVKQLAEFKSGKRPSAVMKAMAAPLSDEDMKHVAAFYASKQPRPGFARSKDTVGLGERIYRGGIADRQVPACSGCHSPNGAGIPSQYARVSGQHAEYTETQLAAFRNGQRPNSPAMTTIAAKLNDREIKALADYMAGLR
jgi:cytochrome c553